MYGRFLELLLIKEEHDKMENFAILSLAYMI